MKAKNKNVTVLEKKEITVQQPASLTMLESAINSGMDPDKLLKFYEIHEKWEKNEARKAYVRAMADFKKEKFEISKDSTVRYENNDGSFTQYSHASLFNVVDTITDKLAMYGLSHKWITEQFPDGGQIEVTCVITHELGHSERTSLRNSPDASGGKNNIQAVGSTVTYLQRYTLLSLTGAATKNQDNDGQDVKKDIEFITEDQQFQIKAKLLETNSDMDKFLKLFNVESLDQLPASEWQKATIILKAKNENS